MRRGLKGGDEILNGQLWRKPAKKTVCIS